MGEGGTSLYPAWFICSGGPQRGSPSLPSVSCPPPSPTVTSPTAGKHQKRSQEQPCSPQQHQEVKTSSLPNLQCPPCPSSDGGTPLDPLGEAPNLLFQPHLGQSQGFQPSCGTLGTQWVPPAGTQGCPPSPRTSHTPSHRWGLCYSFLNNKTHFS